LYKIKDKGDNQLVQNKYKGDNQLVQNKI
jgi:hypothetical protein